MKRGFSIINIIILLGLLLLAYLGYTRYSDDKIKPDLNNSNGYHPPAAKPEATPTEAPTVPAAPAKPPVKTQPTPKTITPAPAEAKPAAEKPATPPVAPKGYYRNNTYNYEISFPEDWPVRIRSEANVSLGTVPPKNGQGAITIEISPGGTNEVEQAKAEAKKYPGIISITEEPVTLAGISGEKIIMNNLMAKTKTIIILLKKSNLNYIIKYGEESAAFTNQAVKALQTFKFIN